MGMRLINLLAFVVFFLSGCGVQQTPAAVTASPAAGTEFSDPFAYCAAVGTIDSPDTRYVGLAVPDMLIKGMKKAEVVSDETPNDIIVKGTFWRCMDGEVLACFVGANIPCWGKADTSETPSEGMTTYCKEEPNSDFIPAVATGRETVYEWRCEDSTPKIVRQLLTPDAQGFHSEFWTKINSVEPN